jgi:hypothetical protein
LKFEEKDHCTSVGTLGRSSSPRGSTVLKYWHNDWNTNVTDGAMASFCKLHQTIYPIKAEKYKIFETTLIFKR